VDNGNIVRISASPAGKAVKRSNRTLPRPQKRPGDAVSVDEPDEDTLVARAGFEITGKEVVAEESDPAVDPVPATRNGAAAGGDVQISIGVIEQSRRLRERPAKCRQPDDDRPGWDQPLTRAAS